ncbi:MAG: hypothetical protein IPJ51_06440 [Saprospiraceae bacterium]|nr:hypothetical protein [Saprospiraceae bacterium]
MKKFLPYVLVLIVVSGAVGYFMYNKPHNETKGATSDVIISPADLLKAYETDEAAADLAYLDKILEVEGIVKSIYVLDQGSSLSLDAGSEMSAITCEFEAADALAGVKPGDKVKIKGFCTGKLMDIVLVRCSL